MLDNSPYIANLDHHNALAMVAGQTAQLAYEFDAMVHPMEDMANIVVLGMGGSALSAEFVRSWLSDRLPIPVEIVRDYHAPAYINDRTLVIASSYSGNTEETLSALSEAEKMGAQIAVVTAGGKLAERAATKGYPAFVLPQGVQPRLALLWGSVAIAHMIEQLGLLDGVVSELAAQVQWLEGEVLAWRLGVKTGHNPAKQIAEALHGHAVVVYAGPTLGAMAMKWKIDVNENAKNLAFYNQFSELNHNEFIGWQHPKTSAFKVVQLHSSLDHPQIKKRFEVSNRLLSGKMPEPIIIEAAGDTKLQQMLWTLLLGDTVTVYLGFLNGIDPVPVPLIEKLKKELA